MWLDGYKTRKGARVDKYSAYDNCKECGKIFYKGKMKIYCPDCKKVKENEVLEVLNTYKPEILIFKLSINNKNTISF